MILDDVKDEGAMTLNSLGLDKSHEGKNLIRHPWQGPHWHTNYLGGQQSMMQPVVRV